MMNSSKPLKTDVENGEEKVNNSLESKDENQWHKPLQEDENACAEEELFNEPHIVKRYKFVSYLGSGSYGHVCEAICLNTGKHVAIKRLHGIFNDKVDAKRFLRELRILRVLRHHESIIKVIHIIPPPDVINFNVLSVVFEFVDTDLSKLIDSDQFFTVGHVKWILYQILLGIKWMHTAQIVHRDLKPANILVNADCSVKICDFGLARGMMENFKQPKPKSSVHASKKKVKYSASNPRGTRSRKLTRHVATRWYRPPEVILFNQEREFLPAVDMWAVGCIFFELLQMLKGNCENPKDRAPLFPGMSCYPLSTKDPFALDDREDQLNVILRVIGSPSELDLRTVINSKARKHLNSLLKYRPVDWRKKVPSSSKIALKLLRGLVQFNCRKRFTVGQALAHSFLKIVRDREVEVRHRQTMFDFEDIPLKLETIKNLLIDEILLYNPHLAEKLSNSK